MFGNTLTADHMYSRHYLTEISTTCSNVIFIAFSQSTHNFVHFEKKDQIFSLNILEVIDSEKCGYFNVWKLLF